MGSRRGVAAVAAGPDRVAQLPLPFMLGIIERPGGAPLVIERPESCPPRTKAVAVALSRILRLAG